MGPQRGTGKMADRNRYRRFRPEDEQAERAERQAGFLTFQILMVALLLAAVWAAKALHLQAFEDIQRLAQLLDGDNRHVCAVIGYEQIAALLREHFQLDLDGLLEGLPLPSLDTSGSAGAENRADAMGGAYPGLLFMQGKEPQRPRSVTFSPVLLTAQPQVPVSGQVSSGFGWRDNPLSPGSFDFHTGLDIAAGEGTPILAALPGTVSDTGYSDSYGNFIHVVHAGGLETHYAHCAQIIAKTGENIRQGERIALVGSTGKVTGPHLHFEIRQGGLCCDPLIQLRYAV